MPDQQQVEGQDAGVLAGKAQAVAMVSLPHRLLSAAHTSRPETGVSCQDTDDQENKPQDNAAVPRSLSNIVTSWGSVKSNKRKQPDVAAITGAFTLNAMLAVEQPLCLTACSLPYELHTPVLRH